MSVVSVTNIRYGYIVMTFSQWFPLIHWWQLHVLSVAASIAHLDRRKIEAALPRTPKKDKNIWRKPSSRKLNRNKWQEYCQWRKGHKAWVEWIAPKPTRGLHFLWIFKYKHLKGQLGPRVRHHKWGLPQEEQLEPYVRHQKWAFYQLAPCWTHRGPLPEDRHRA